MLFAHIATLYSWGFALMLSCSFLPSCFKSLHIVVFTILSPCCVTSLLQCNKLFIKCLTNNKNSQNDQILERHLNYFNTNFISLQKQSKHTRRNCEASCTFVRTKVTCPETGNTNFRNSNFLLDGKKEPHQEVLYSNQ